MLESFKKLKPEQQFQEFARGRVAESCMDNIVKVIQGLSDEERKEACDKFDFIKEIMLHSLAYLELGTYFGYAENKEK